MKTEKGNIPGINIAELRKFGMLLGIILGLFGALLLWGERSWYAYGITFFSILFLFLGLVFPHRLQLTYKAWMMIGELLGLLMTRVILCVLFFGIVSPIGILAKLCGKTFLDLKFKTDLNSYWIPKNQKQSKEDYEKQF